MTVSSDIWILMWFHLGAVFFVRSNCNQIHLQNQNPFCLLGNLNGALIFPQICVLSMLYNFQTQNMLRDTEALQLDLYDLDKCSKQCLDVMLNGRLH